MKRWELRTLSTPGGSPGAPSIPTWGPTCVPCPLGRALGLPVNAREGTPVLSRGIGSFSSQGSYCFGRGETLTFRLLTGLGKRRAVQINAMYNESENCQNWVFHTHCKTETWFFFCWLKNSLVRCFFFFFFHLEMSCFQIEMRFCLEISKICPIFKQRGFAMGMSRFAQWHTRVRVPMWELCLTKQKTEPGWWCLQHHPKRVGEERCRCACQVREYILFFLHS